MRLVQGAGMPGAQAKSARLHEAVASFAALIHESLDMERVGANYMAAIAPLIQANSYGMYLLDPRGGRPKRIAVNGGVDRFIARYELAAYAQDPLLRYMTRTREPVHEGQLFSDVEWQRTPLRRALTRRNQAPRILEAPIIVGENVRGVLFFTRRPDDSPPFGDDDVRMLKTIANHVCLAVGHALRFAEMKVRCEISEEALQLVDVPLMLSDPAGNVRFSNRAAKLALRSADEAVRGGGFRDTFLKNLDRLAAGHQSMAAARVASSGSGAGSSGLVLRSTVVPVGEPVVATFICRDEHDEAEATAARPVLSHRELEVLELLTQGLQNKEIAQRLFVSTNTVKYHVKRIYRAVGVASRTELLSRAYAGSLL